MNRPYHSTNVTCIRTCRMCLYARCAFMPIFSPTSVKFPYGFTETAAHKCARASKKTRTPKRRKRHRDGCKRERKPPDHQRLSIWRAMLAKSFSSSYRCMFIRVEEVLAKTSNFSSCISGIEISITTQLTNSIIQRETKYKKKLVRRCEYKVAHQKTL